MNNASVVFEDDDDKDQIIIPLPLDQVSYNFLKLQLQNTKLSTTNLKLLDSTILSPSCPCSEYELRA